MENKPQSLSPNCFCVASNWRVMDLQELWIIAAIWDCTFSVLAYFFVSYTLTKDEFTPSTVNQWFPAYIIWTKGLSVLGKDKSCPYFGSCKPETQENCDFKRSFAALMWTSFSHFPFCMSSKGGILKDTICSTVFLLFSFSCRMTDFDKDWWFSAIM